MDVLGSEEEREAVHRASRYSSRKDQGVYDLPEPDVCFDLETPEDAEVGQDFEIKVRMKNKVAKQRSVNMRVTLVISFYTGVTSEQVTTITFKEKLGRKMGELIFYFKKNPQNNAVNHIYVKVKIGAQFKKGVLA